MSENTLPVVVVGAGPVGLAAAAHLLDRGLEPLVLEAGEQAGVRFPRDRGGFLCRVSGEGGVLVVDR